MSALRDQGAVELAPCAQTFRYRTVKRVFDCVLAVTLLVLLGPLMLLIAFLVWATSGAPIFYKWNVVGLLGRTYSGYKFRTMVRDAEAQEIALSKFNERQGPAFKMSADPRVTPVGRVLRRFSLDELPQLLNIARGDMSFIGPRSLKPREWEAMEEWQRRKFSVVPGAISLWHVSGQPPTLSDWVRWDLKYIDSWSLLLDAEVLVRGAAYVCFGRNK